MDTDSRTIQTPDVLQMQGLPMPQRSPLQMSSALSAAPQTPAVRHICCIGAGYVGGPTCAVIANKIPSITVTVVDLDAKRIEAWNSSHLPIYEPGLLDIVIPARDGVKESQRSPNLFFTTDVEGAIAKADLIFLCVATPTKITGTGGGSAADMVYIETATRMIANVSTSDKIIVEKSTVPCGTAISIRETFTALGKPGLHFDILSNPEFLSEGTAISDLLAPDRVLIGSMDTPRGRDAAKMLADVYAQWIRLDRILTMQVWSSEMAKLAANAMLAQRISSMNALSAVCEENGADIEEVSYACGLDKRIGPQMLKSSVGFGGSCFKKDVLSLVYMCESSHLPEVAAYWKAVVDMNEYQKSRFIKRIVTRLFRTLTDKKIAVLGYAYKKNTGDTRESAAITIVNSLVAENAHVSIYDPKVEPAQIWASLTAVGGDFGHLTKRVTICSTPYQACHAAHAVVIATEWDEFSNKSPAVAPEDSAHDVSMTPLQHPPANPLETQIESPSDVVPTSSQRIDDLAALGFHEDANRTHTRPEPTSQERLDWEYVATVMKRPMFVFDGRNIVDAEKLVKLGFRVEGIGKASMTPTI